MTLTNQIKSLRTTGGHCALPLHTHFPLRGNSPRKLQIDLDELAFVFHSSEPMIESYLDLQDGRIIMVKIDTRYQLDQIYDEYSLDTAEELDLPLILDRLDISDWERQELLEADEVEAGLDERYIRIPKAVSRQEYQDIEEFIETVQDPRLKEHLEQAIEDLDLENIENEIPA